MGAWSSSPRIRARKVGRSDTLALVGASPSRFGTINSQAQLRQFLPTQGVHLMGSPILAVSVGKDTFDDDGAAESATTRQATKYIEAFTSFVET